MKRILTVLLVVVILMTSTTAFAEPIPYKHDDLEDVVQIAEDVDILMDSVSTQSIRLKLDLDFERAIDVLQNTLRHIEIKAQFVRNTREVWDLNKEIDRNLKQIARELKDIRKSDRELTAEQFKEIKEIKGELKQDIREAEYRIGSIAKETVIFVKAVKDKKFIKAHDTFNNILILQKQQIEFLEAILKNTSNLLEVLQNIA